MSLGNKINQKGIYELVSSFFIIILIVVVLLFMVYLGSSSSAGYSNISDNISYLNEANTIRDNILFCFGQLDYNTINSANVNTCMNSKIKGYELSTMNFLKCTQSDVKKEFGVYSDCTNKVSFYVSIINSKGHSCLGRLNLCFGE